MSQVFSEIEESAENVGPMLEPYTVLLTSLAGIEGKGLNAMAGSLKKIKNAMVQMPMNKMEQLTTMMSAAQAVQLSAAAIGMNLNSPETVKNLTGGGGGGSAEEKIVAKYTIPIELKVDNEVFKKKVLTIIGERVMADALQ